MSAPYESVGPVATGLPDATQLFAAVSGCVEEGSPLIGWARELADLHATLIAAAVSASNRPRGFDVFATMDRHAEVVALVDGWAQLHLPNPRNARQHTHSLGEVFSQIALASARTQWLLRHDQSAEETSRGAANFGLVRQGYADLVDDIRNLRVVLVPGWRATFANRGQ